MSDHIVSDLTEMIRSSFDRNETIDLASLLWSIDAKHRLIPEVNEINSALSSISKYKITRNENQVYLTN
jgi:hypothetical protein